MTRGSVILSSFIRQSIGSLLKETQCSSLPALQLCLRPTSTRTAALAIPPPPKKPLTPYMRFVKERRAEFTKEKQELKQSEIIKIIAADWRELDPSKKQVYQTQYTEEANNYVKMRESYISKLTPEQIKVIKMQRDEKRSERIKAQMTKKMRELNCPKRGVTAFGLFIYENTAGMKGMNGPELLKAVAEKWKNLSEEEKRTYQEKAKDERSKKAQEYEKWKKKMAKEGHEDVLNYLEGKHKHAKTSRTVAKSETAASHHKTKKEAK